MARRNSGNMHGEQFLGNTHKKEVHDLDNEQVNCQINEIIRAGHAKPFSTHPPAKTAGYDNCAYCLAGSKK